jgi:hypothetical protein
MDWPQRLLPVFNIPGQKQRALAAFHCAKPAVFYHLVNERMAQPVSFTKLPNCKRL